MILDSVTLENIRSYTDSTTIRLPTGSTLFEGDIGSGKSSILSAIEFALFGLGDVDGRYLLNSRSKRGSVLLEFRVGERRYKVHRELLRNKTSVVQGGGYIVEGDVRTEYAVTGMRARILDIVGIRERQQTKTTSLIYRSAIFSPQEMMKEILTEDTERRLDTLRRAFGIEDYSNAKKNADAVDGWASGEARVSAALSRDLQQSRQTLNKEEANLAKLSSEADPLNSMLKVLERGIAIAEEKMAGMKGQRDEVFLLEASIPSLQNRVGDSKNALAEERRRLSKLKEELSELEKAERRLGELGQRYAEYVQGKHELDSLESTSEEYSNRESERQRMKAALSEKTARLQQEVSDLREETQKEEAELQDELKELEPLPKLKTRVSELGKSVAEIEKSRKKSGEINAAMEKLKLEKAPLQNEIRESKSEMDGILAIGTGAPCPKCRRPLDEGHLRQLKARFKTEVGAKRKRVAGLQERLSKVTLENKTIEEKLAALLKDENELRQLEPKVSALDAKAGNVRKAESRLGGRREKLKKLEETLRKKDFAQAEKAQLESIELLLEEQGPIVARFKELKRSVQAAEREQIHSIYLNSAEKVRRKPQLEEEAKIGEQRVASGEESLRKLEGELEEKKAEYSRKKPALKALASFEKERERLGEEREEATKRLVTITANLDNTKERIKSVSDQVKQMERSNRRKLYFEQIRAWLDTCFVPAVDDIERNTLMTVNESFNQEFQKWFRVLIETEDMEVEVDQSFTPMVTQGGYSLDVNSLSGGERTSVALAYRLALNVTARAAIGLEPDLLILDEPTDGFSSVQLTKLSQVLDGLRTAQVIMVSHERELETYVNHICKVTKVGGVSRVQFGESTLQPQ